jgi:hypothetical protein
MRTETVKAIKAGARKSIPVPANKSHRDRSKYTRKRKHKESRDEY